MTLWQAFALGILLGVPGGMWLTVYFAFLKGENDLG